MTKGTLYSGRDPADVPAYTAAEAASLVGVPVSTLRSWVFGRNFPTRGGEVRRSHGLIKAPDPRFLSFTNVVEAHVLAGLRRKYELELEKVRKAVGYVEKQLAVKQPLAREQFKTDGVDLFVERFGTLINASSDGQVAMREVLDGYLERVEYDRGRAVRFFPVPMHRPEAPRFIVVDPRRAFGRPVLDGTAVPVADVVGRFHHGDSVETLAADFGVSGAAIQEALRVAPSKAA